MFWFKHGDFMIFVILWFKHVVFFLNDFTIFVIFWFKHTVIFFDFKEMIRKEIRSVVCWMEKHLTSTWQFQ